MLSYAKKLPNFSYKKKKDLWTNQGLPRMGRYKTKGRKRLDEHWKREGPSKLFEIGNGSRDNSKYRELEIKKMKVKGTHL